MKKNITFLFGAGAEVGKDFYLPSGYEFLLDSIFASSTDNIYKYLFESIKNVCYYENIATKNFYKHTDDYILINISILRNFIESRIEVEGEKFIKNTQEELCCILTPEQIKELNNKYKLKLEQEKNKESQEKEKKLQKEILDKFTSVILGRTNLFANLKSEFLENLFDNVDGKISFDIKVGISGTLDRYFHTIIDPCKYGRVKFSRIFNYYWACYFSIVKKIVKTNCIKVGNYIKEDGELNCQMVFENIVDFTNKLYDYQFEDLNLKNNYYYFIKEKLEEHSNKLNCYGVLTTNYFNYVEKVSTNVSYLSGTLKTFELPEKLKVVMIDENIKEEDKNKFSKENLYFPFIFGQSFLKPIVDKFQIDEFHKAYNILSESDILIIIGYGLNEDDNHINSLLRWFINSKDKKLIIVNDTDISTISDKLKITKVDGIEPPIQYTNKSTEEVVNELFNKLT